MMLRSFASSVTRLGAVIAVCLLALTWTPALHAQATTADILGRVTDATGAAMPQSNVSLTSLTTAEVRTTTTDDNGDFLFNLVPSGHYSLKIERSGFKSWTVADAAVSSGDRLRLDATLDVGTVEQSVQVTAQSAALQTDTSTTGTLINDQAVQDLPTNGRNFVTLVQLAAGAADSTVGFSGGTATDDRRLTSQVQVNGQFTFFNNFMIDGMDDNERFIGTVTVKPALESIQEMKVTTTVYGADLGRTAGGVINMVTKSGGNQFHGTGYEFFRNQELDARNFFAKTATVVKPPYRQNQYGGSLGGPIKKDKTFFFMDYEALRLGQNTLPVTSTVPIQNGLVPTNANGTLACPAGSPAGTCIPFDGSTNGARNGDFSGYGANIYNPLSCNFQGCTRSQFAGDVIPAGSQDPAGVALLDLYPGPNQGVPGQLTNNYLAIPVTINNEDTGDVRVDHRFSDSDSLFVRYTVADIRVLLPPNIPIVADGSQTNERTQGGMVDYVHTFNPRLLGELKFGYSRFRLATVGNSFNQFPATKLLGLPNGNLAGDPKQSEFPAFSFTGGFASNAGDAGFNPEFNTNNTYELNGSILKQVSAHSIKVGAIYRKRLDSQNQQQSSNGSFPFSSLQTQLLGQGNTSSGGNSLASAVLGFANAVTQQKQLNNPAYRFTEGGAYIQDDWRARNWLTLNLGLRYDYYGPLYEVHNNIANFIFATQTIETAGTNGLGSSDGVSMGKKNFSPRLGFAATLNRKTVIRGGAGMSYVPFFMGTPYAFRNAPFVAAYSSAPNPIYPNFALTTSANSCGAALANVPTTVPPFTVQCGLPVPSAQMASNPFGQVYFNFPHLKIPYLYQTNLFIQRDLGAGLVLSVGYVGIFGRDQGFPNANLDVNQPAPGPTSTVQARRPYAGLYANMQQLNGFGTYAETEYNGLQASLERRFKSGFGAVVNYTYSHALDNFEYQPLTQYVAGAPLGNFRLDWGNSSIDLRQRFTATANYQLPFARSATGIKGAVAKGWQLNTIIQLQSGLPFSVANATDVAGTNSEGGNRPNVVSSAYQAGNPAGTRQAQAGSNCPDANSTTAGPGPAIVHTTALTPTGGLVPWYNPCAFQPQPEIAPNYIYGNEHRLQYFGPPAKTVAFSASKDFPINERMRFQFRGEMFNLFNHPNFGLPNGTIGGGATGTITSTASGALGLARNVQLALKFIF